MASVAQYLETAVLNHFFRGVSTPAPAAVFVALFNGDPDSGGEELEADGYARVLAAFAAPINGDDGRMRVENSERIEFPRAEAFWGRVSHFCIYDARTSGAALACGPLRTPKLIETDDILEFKAKELRVEYRTPKGDA